MNNVKKWDDCPRCGAINRVRHDSYWGPEMKRRRLEAGLSLREVARRMGMDAAHICRLEQGKQHWVDTTFAAYSDAIAVLTNGEGRR